MLNAWLFAFLLGALVSVPFGPVGLYMLSRGVKNGLAEVAPLVIFCALNHMIICTVSLLGLGPIFQTTAAGPFVRIVALFLFATVGVHSLFFSKRAERMQLSDDPTQRALRDSLDGRLPAAGRVARDAALAVSSALANPTPLLFWLNVTPHISEHLLAAPGILCCAEFGLAVGAGSVSTQALSVALLRSRRHSEKFSRAGISLVRAVFLATLLFLAIRLTTALHGGTG